jgi:hypothetical protein
LEAVIFNTLNDEFNLDENDYKIIPINRCPTKFYSITFQGWDKVSIDSNDSGLITMVKLATDTLKCLIKLYKKTHAFTQPKFYYKPDGTFGVKIGTMENELYEKIFNKNE